MSNAKQQALHNKKMGEHRTRQITSFLKEKRPNHKEKQRRTQRHLDRKESNDYERYGAGQSHSLSEQRIAEIREETNDALYNEERPR